MVNSVLCPVMKGNTVIIEGRIGDLCVGVCTCVRCNCSAAIGPVIVVFSNVMGLILTCLLKL